MLLFVLLLLLKVQRLLQLLLTHTATTILSKGTMTDAHERTILDFSKKIKKMKTKMKFSALQVINSDSSITMDHNRKRKKRRHQKVDAFTSFKPELNNAKKRKEKETNDRRDPRFSIKS